MPGQTLSHTDLYNPRPPPPPPRAIGNRGPRDGHALSKHSAVVVVLKSHCRKLSYPHASVPGSVFMGGQLFPEPHGAPGSATGPRAEDPQLVQQWFLPWGEHGFAQPSPGQRASSFLPHAEFILRIRVYKCVCFRMIIKNACPSVRNKCTSYINVMEYYAAIKIDGMGINLLMRKDGQALTFRCLKIRP